MNTEFFMKFAKFKFGSLVNAEDFADKINYQWTGSMLIICTALIAMRQYIFTPIQCWVPAEWPRPWEEYTENYCWIQNTYAVNTTGQMFPKIESRQQLELNYYQWVPFMLALEALLVYTPHMWWKIVTVRSGYNPNSIVKFAADAATVDQDKKKKLVAFLAAQIKRAMDTRRKWRSHRDDCCRAPDIVRTVLPCFWFGKRSGTMLFALYISNKLVYAGVAVLHLYIMKKFLGLSFDFGWRCMSDLMQGRDWEQTKTFPRVTFCDVPARKIGTWTSTPVQCVLPVNLLNEKIYIFLWFWTIMCLCLTAVSTLMWFGKMLVMKNRQYFIKKYLRVLQVIAQEDEEQEEKETRKRFVDDFLQLDGLFLLRMIAGNVGDVCAADIVKSMYEQYRDGTDPAAAVESDRSKARTDRRKSTLPNLNHTNSSNSLSLRAKQPPDYDMQLLKSDV